MADYGLVQGIASGLREGINSYRSERDRQDRLEQEALDRKMKEAAFELEKKRSEDALALQSAKEGLIRAPEGGFIRSPESLEAEKRQRQLDMFKAGAQELPSGKLGYLPLSPEKQAEAAYRRAQTAKEMAMADYYKASKQEKEAPIVTGAAQGQKALAPQAQFKQLPKETQIQVEDLARDTAKKSAIANTLRGDLQRLEDPKLNSEQKLVHARSMIKTLNSKAGQDAVGAEEAKRLAGLLEFRMFNLTEPGPMFGRAPISDFANQVKNTVASLESSSLLNKQQIDKLYGRDQGMLAQSDAQGMLGEDVEALNWARQNPNDPRAKKIMQIHNIGGM